MDQTFCRRFCLVCGRVEGEQLLLRRHESKGKITPYRLTRETRSRGPLFSDKRFCEGSTVGTSLTIHLILVPRPTNTGYSSPGRLARPGVLEAVVARQVFVVHGLAPCLRSVRTSWLLCGFGRVTAEGATHHAVSLPPHEIQAHAMHRD